MSKIVFTDTKDEIMFYFPSMPQKRKCRHPDGRIIANGNKMEGV